MQVVRSCNDDISIRMGPLKFLCHFLASFPKYGIKDLTMVPIVFVCHVNDHACLRRVKEKKNGEYIL